MRTEASFLPGFREGRKGRGSFPGRGSSPIYWRQPSRRDGRVAEGGGLLNRYRVEKLYRGFESLSLRQISPPIRSRNAVALAQRELPPTGRTIGYCSFALCGCRSGHARRETSAPVLTWRLSELVAQLVEQRPFKAWVLGSNPSGLTTHKRITLFCPASTEQDNSVSPPSFVDR